MNLYILKYNNYYNRTIKIEDNISDYLPYLLGDVIQGVAFNPSDGVMTKQIVNLTEDQLGDYLVALDEYNQINSRWFILDTQRERTGQYTLTLRRDLVADNYNTIINSPCFIEKATLSSNDPMIFNSENMTFNQIKTSETLLKDQSGVAWIVGYFARTNGEGYTNLTGTVGEVTNPDIISTAQTIQDTDLYQYINFTSLTPTYVMYNVFIDGTSQPGNYYYRCDINESTAKYYEVPLTGDKSGIKVRSGNLNRNAVIGIQSNLDFENCFNQISAYYEYTPTYMVESTVLGYNGKIIKTQDGKFHKITLTQQPYSVTVDITAGVLFTYLSNAVATQSTDLYGTPNNQSFKVVLRGNQFKLSFEELTLSTSNYDIPQNRYHLEDSPYDMFAIPYGNITINNTGVGQTWTSITVDSTNALLIAQAISNKYGSTFLYDLQLLPYCPVSNLIQSDGTLDVLGDDLLYSLVTNTSDSTNVGIIFNCSRSSGTFNIPLSLVVQDYKVESECDMYRLCSPNYNGMFQFNLAKNGGVSYFNVDYTYKPYNPYIHINPNFGRLYGQDFNDSRGLICGGDFSLPVVQDRWFEYELNNKNYQNIFDRQVENLEITQGVQRERELWQLGLGAASTALGGAFSGAILGGGLGAGIGAGLGGGLSVLAGIRDLQLNDKLRTEAIDYLKDQFGYQLGNIQALPDSLGKTTAFTYNNKIFPILEYYTCTDEEKEALKNKIYYNGMTVMRIGTISEFIRSEPSYIKGQIIRLEGTENNYHVVNEIANEINKGVFI